MLVTRSRVSDLARAAEPIYRRQLRLRLHSNSSIEIVPLAKLASIEGSTVRFTLDASGERQVLARAFVMAQGREPAHDIASYIRAANVPHAVIGDARSIGRIGDAVHAAHYAVRTLDATLRTAEAPTEQPK